MKICISPSTQQNNTGPNGYIEETEMNRIADILCPELIRHGISVYRIPRTMDSVNDIVNASNKYNPDYHIAIHSNAGGGTGCEIWCSNPKIATHKGTQMAQAIYKYLAPITLTPNDRGLKDESGNIGEVGRTTAPAVLMEIEFHDNATGAEWIKKRTNDIAQAILKGILEQCGIKYIPPVVVENKDEIIRNLRLRVETLSAEVKTLTAEKQSANVSLTAANVNLKTANAKLTQIRLIARE
jgi:N-acetylmuramoyl-L-alanine amidase